MDYYNRIKEELIKSEIYNRARDYQKERHKVEVYYEIGRLLYEAGKEYGKNIVRQYSEKLVIEVGKKYNERTLYSMRKFYVVFNQQKLNTLCSKLTWSHYRELLVLKNVDEISYYIYISEKYRLTQRQLKAKITSNEYNRLSNEARNKLINNEELQVRDLIPNPIVIKTDSLIDNFSEYSLKQAITLNLDSFLAQLGPGFFYGGQEYKIKLGDYYNYIDLLLFNIEYNCYVVIELKVTELKKEHIGQIQVYMNYIDNNLRKYNQDKTIGIIICKKNNKYIIEYSSDPRIIAREYELV